MSTNSKEVRKYADENIKNVAVAYPGGCCVSADELACILSENFPSSDYEELATIAQKAVNAFYKSVGL